MTCLISVYLSAFNERRGKYNVVVAEITATSSAATHNVDLEDDGGAHDGHGGESAEPCDSGTEQKGCVKGNARGYCIRTSAASQ